MKKGSRKKTGNKTVRSAAVPIGQRTVKKTVGRSVKKTVKKATGKIGNKTVNKATGNIGKKKPGEISRGIGNKTEKKIARSRTDSIATTRRELLAQYEFEYVIYGVFSREEKALRKHLRIMVEDLKLPSLQGPIFAMTHELIANGLKAMHKRIFINEYLRKEKLGNLDYEDWLKLFKSEVEAHQEKNFARICREQNIGVRVSGKLEKDRFRITVVNQGVPGDIEYERLKGSMEKSRKPSFSLSDSLSAGDDDEKHKEGGGIGIQMIVFCLRNLGINTRNFNIFIKQNNTIARIDFPLSFFEESEKSGA